MQESNDRSVFPEDSRNYMPGLLVKIEEGTAILTETIKIGEEKLPGKRHDSFGGKVCKLRNATECTVVVCGGDDPDAELRTSNQCWRWQGISEGFEKAGSLIVVL